MSRCRSAVPQLRRARAAAHTQHGRRAAAALAPAGRRSPRFLSKMAAPSGRSGRSSWAALVPAALLCLAARAAAGPGTAPGAAPSTAGFDVRPGGEVHSFSRGLGDFSCTFTYSAQGGTNEQWQMNVAVSEDSNGLFSCSIWRPQGKSYLFFTQFKAEVKGAKIEHAMAYSQAAVGAQSDVPLKQEEFEVTETAVSHREGKFRFELSKLEIVAKPARDEL
ncbi:myeloid-derived growth factor [Prinia subflava]|uniref:myeloid-derived growth factor n=1 Tax=Prinia subflava TaxID=208062 RepID=UPI002FE186D2